MVLLLEISYRRLEDQEAETARSPFRRVEFTSTVESESATKICRKEKESETEAERERERGERGREGGREEEREKRGRYHRDGGKGASFSIRKRGWCRSQEV